MRNSTLGISLIITTYNRPDALELVLLSVKTQTILPMEVIVADDGSGSTTRDLILKHQLDFPVPLKHSWHEDQGFRLAKTRNKAIQMAKGEYIICIDGDIVLSPNVVKAHREFITPESWVQGSRVLLDENFSQKVILEKDIRLSFFSGRETRCRENAIRLPFLKYILKGKGYTMSGIKGCHMGYWKKDVLAVNGFNEDFTGWGREDTEFALRLMNAGIKRKNLKFDAITYHLFHPESSKSNHDHNERLALEVIDKKLTWCDNGILKS